MGLGASAPQPRLLALLPADFVGHELFRTALTHRSAASSALASNERLEFLGDAVLELVVSDRLFHEFAHVGEGRLTKLRAALVSRATLASRAADLDLAALLIVGQSDAVSANALANALEAVIGGLYEALGLAETRRFIGKLLDPVLVELADDVILGDYKSRLHEVLAQLRRNPPIFDATWTGPDHERVFDVTVHVEGLSALKGLGRSRKEAEQAACQAALVELAASQLLTGQAGDADLDRTEPKEGGKDPADGA